MDASGKPLKVIKLAKVPGASASNRFSSLRLLARFCYYYPAYTLADARKLPYKHVMMMLKVARQMEAERYYTMTQIVAAPHTKKGKGVESLTAQFRKVMRNG